MPYSLAIEVVYMFILSKNISVLPLFHSQIKQKIVNYSRKMSRSKSNGGISVKEQRSGRLDTFFNNSFGPDVQSFGGEQIDAGAARRVSKNGSSADD